MTERHYFRARLVKDGPFVGVVTWFGPPVVDGEILDRSPRWQALIDTELTGRAVLMGDEVPIDIDGVTLRNIESVKPEEYFYLVAHADWIAKYARKHPKAAPRKPVNYHTLKPRF